MADRIITVDVQSNLREQTQEAKQFNKELDRVERQRSATRTGSRAADAALGVSDVGLRRGTTGAGGRGGERDFARQAQGLGGLVHIYATFAANIYAVTAAFSALQKAAAADSLLEAADTLSSRYGVSLKGLSKQLQETTGYAISANQALTFAQLGASAGVNTRQMNELAKVATGASKALGRDLSDAMERIYRGAIKVEPELLDELGIMVKVDEASSVYARTLNKTASSLTDVEKRQAFVNAVIEQGSTKFSKAAELAANPYDKLQASLANVGTEGLSVLNTVFKPIAKILSESPTALIAVLTAIIGKLAKMAMPDILPKAEERFSKAQEQLMSAAEKLKTANKQVAKAFEETSAFKFISSETTSKALKKAAPLIRQLQDSLQKDIEATKPGERVKLSVDTENLRLQVENAVKQGIANAQSILKRKGLKPGTIAARETDISQAEETLQYTKDLAKGLDTVADSEKIQGNLRVTQNLQTIKMLKEQTALKVAQLQIEGKHRAAILAAWQGQRAITKELQLQNASYGKGIITKGITEVGGAISGVTSVAKTIGTSVISKLPMIGLAVGTITSVAGAIDSAAQYYNLATDNYSKLTEQGGKAKDTIKALKNSFDDLAQATTLNEIFELKQGNLKLLAEAAESVKTIADQYQRAVVNATTYDKTVEFIKKITPLATTGQQVYAETITSTAASMSRAGQINIDTEIQDLKSKLLMMSATTEEELANMSSEQVLKLASKWPDYVGVEFNKLSLKIQEGGKAAAATAARMEQISTTIKDVGNITKDFVNKLIPQTELTKLSDSITQGFLGALDGAEQMAKFLKVFSADLEGMVAMPGFTTNIREVSAELDNLSKGYQLVRKYIQENTKDEVEKKKALENLSAAEKESITNTVSRNNVFSLVTIAVLEVTSATEKLGKASIDAEKAIALLNRDLRLIGAVESVFGKTLGTERTKQEKEAQIIAQERKSLETQTKQLAAIAVARLKSVQPSLQAAGITNAPEQLMGQGGLDILSGAAKTASETLNGLKVGTEEYTKQAELVKTILGAQDQLSTVLLAQTNITAKLAILDAKKLTAYEKDLALIRAQASEDATNLDKREKALNSELNLLKTKAGLLNEISTGLDNELQLAILRIEKDKELVVLQKERRAAEQRLSEIQTGSDTFLANLGIKNRKQAEEDQKQIVKGIEDQIKFAEVLYRVKLATLDISNKEKLNQQYQKLYNTQLSITSQLADSELTTFTNRFSLLTQSLGLERQITSSKIESLNNSIKIKEETIKEAKANNLITESTAAEVELQDLKLQKQLLLAQQLDKELKIRKEIVTAGLKAFEQERTGDFRQYMQLAGEDFILKIKEARRTAESVASMFNAGVINSVDTTIDEFSKMMQQGTLNLKELGTFARNQLSNVFMQMSAQILKDAWKNLILGEDPNKKATIELTSSINTLTTSIDTLNTRISTPTIGTGQATTFQATSAGGDISNISYEALMGTTEPMIEAGDKAKTASETQNIAANTAKKGSETLLESSTKAMDASTMLMLFTGQWKQAAMMFLTKLSMTMLATGGSGGGGDSIFGTLIKAGIGYLTGGPVGAATAGLSSFGATAVSGMGNSNVPVFVDVAAKGGIMTSEYGLVKASKYEKGGIATGPQLAIFGEGRQNEAYVPLPDNRSIPVTLNGSGGVSIGDTNISVTINSSTGQAEVSTKESTDMAKLLAGSVKQVVQEEFIKQSRPGGLIYGMRR